MEFETKMRVMVQKIIAPVIEASLQNRENALLIQESNKDLNKRTVLLEKATFQTGKYKKPTLIETMLQRIESMEQQTKDVIIEMRDLNKEHILSLDQRFFIYEQKVKEVLLLKEKFKRG